MTLISMVKAGNQLEMATGIHIQRFKKKKWFIILSFQNVYFSALIHKVVFHNNFFDQTVVTGIKQ